jgi:hypothetical protein
MFTKRNKYVVNQKLELFDVISFKELLVESEWFFLYERLHTGASQEK